MKRRAFFAALAGAAPIAASDPCPVGIRVDAGPSIFVTIPNMDKQQLVDITSTFFGRDLPRPTKELRDLFGKAKSVSLTLTTRCEK